MKNQVYFKGEFAKSNSADETSTICLDLAKNLINHLKKSCHEVNPPEQIEFITHHGKVKHWAFYCVVRNQRFLISLTIYNHFCMPLGSGYDFEEFTFNQDNAEQVAWITVDATLPFWSRLIGPGDRIEHQELCAKVDQILIADGRFTEVNWCGEI